MQLCVSVRLPVEQKGLDGDSIVIGIQMSLFGSSDGFLSLDTEGSFSIDRLFEIAQGTLDVHCPATRKRPQGSVESPRRHSTPSISITGRKHDSREYPRRRSLFQGAQSHSAGMVSSSVCTSCRCFVAGGV